MNRRLLLLVFLTSVFAFIIIIWYFFFSTPKTAENLSLPSNPLGGEGVPVRFGFINNKDNTEKETDSSYSTTEITTLEEQPLVLVWDKPSTGNIFIEITNIKEIISTTTKTIKGKKVEVEIKKNEISTSTSLMFVDRTTGYVYGFSVEKNKAYQISNTTIPGIYDAYIFNNGKQILIRSLSDDKKTIISTLANVPTVKENETPLPLVSVVYLQDNIKSVAVSQSSSKLSYLVSSNEGSYIYTVSSNGRQLTTTSPLNDWILSYGGEQLYATTRPSAYISGLTVSLPSFSRVLGDKTGLISHPLPEGNIINSMWSKTGLTTFLFSKNGNTSVLPIKTIASKCAWKNSTFVLCSVPSQIPISEEGLPDDWNQGRTTFSDSFSLIDINNKDVYPLYSFDKKLGDFDVVNLKLSLSDNLVSFINKKDSLLWLLKTDLLSGH